MTQKKKSKKKLPTRKATPAEIALDNNRLFYVTEIFESISGEINSFGGLGLPTTFVRFWGCNLDCFYCDTRYARDGQRQHRMPLDEVLTLIRYMGNQRHVLLTGGEPLMQSNLKDLLTVLHARKYSVTIETNGSFNIAGLREEHWLDTVSVVMDRKWEDDMSPDFHCPPLVFVTENWWHLTLNDWLKYVVFGPETLKNVVEEIGQCQHFDTHFNIALSPVMTKSIKDDVFVKLVIETVQMLPRMFPDWRGKFMFSPQLHKLIGVP